MNPSINNYSSNKRELFFSEEILHPKKIKSTRETIRSTKIESISFEDFSNILNTFSNQEKSLKGRLDLLQTIQGLNHFPYQIKLSYSNQQLLLIFDRQLETLQLLKQETVLLKLKHTLDNELLVESSSKSFLKLNQFLIDFWDLSEHVISLNLLEWKTIFAHNHFQNFTDRLRFLKQQLTFVQNEKAQGCKNWWQAWLEIDAPSESNPKGTYLNIILAEDVYDSNTCEQDIRIGKTQVDDKYFFIKIFAESDVDLNNPIYVFRSDLQGQLAELIYISAIPHKISGNQMRDLIHLPIENFFKFHQIILHDSAKITLPTTEKQKLFLRLMKATSWYESIGYKPLDCKELKMCSGKKVTQSSLYYQTATEKLKKITLKEIYNEILNGYPQQRKKLCIILNKYFQIKDFDHYTTLINLIEKINNDLRAEKSSSKQALICKDLLFLYDNLLNPFKLDNKNCTLQQKSYNLALSVIKGTKIFHKKNQIENSFIEVSFDDLVKDNITKHQISLWKEYIQIISTN